MTQITRRQFHKLVGTSLLSTAVCPGGWSEKKRKPNLVIIMADDLGYGDLGCYGNEDYQTPHIDSLSQGGLKFTDFHSNGSVCTPTRAALLTGRYQQRSGLEGVIYVRGETREVGMPQKEITFAEVLKEAGYATGIFGKWHLGYKKEFNPVQQGFDVFRGYVSGNIDYHSHVDNAGIPDWWHNVEKVEEEGYVTDLITDHAVQFMRENREKPFCVYLAHEAPHWPYQGREDKPDRFPGEDFPAHGTREDKHNAYKEMVEAMDDSVGRVIETLEELGLEEDTFVFFCSDNGAVPQLGNNGRLRGDKSSLWEGGHRVPAIAYWPGKIEAGTKTPETVLTMDLFPTMAALANAKLPEENQLDGKDLSPVLFDNGSLDSRDLFWRYRKQKCMRRGNWKLLVDNGTPKLFNLAHDLEESKNVADEYKERMKGMMNALSAWEKDVLSHGELITK